VEGGSGSSASGMMTRGVFKPSEMERRAGSSYAPAARWEARAVAGKDPAALFEAHPVCHQVMCAKPQNNCIAMSRARFQLESSSRRGHQRWTPPVSNSKGKPFGTSAPIEQHREGCRRVIHDAILHTLEHARCASPLRKRKNRGHSGVTDHARVS
jgi:hypothetical protein